MKNKAIRFTSKFLSIFLSVLFVAEILPMQVMAEAYNDWANSRSYINELIENPTSNKESTSDILYEVTEKRDEYTKVYKKSNGTYTALVSKTPIHFLDNGVWEEINNSLIAENGIVTNISNTFNVLFPSAISDDEQITVESGGSQIAFSVTDIDSGIGNIENCIGEFDVNIEAAENALANTQSSITYKNACNGTDIQYTVLPNAIKENIIVSSKETLKGSYSFVFEIGELNYTLNEDGSINFNDGDEIKFTIPRPVMTDSNYSLSYDIDTAVSNNNDGTITLTYTPSTVWTSGNDRVYPINIDPAIVISDESYSENAFVESDKPTENFYNTSIAVIANGKTIDEDTNELVPIDLYSELYIKFDIDSIKCLTESVTPTNVQLVTSGVGCNIAAYEILDSCDFQTVTYDTKPQKAETPLDFYTGYLDVEDMQLIHFDITELFDNWVNGRKANLGMAIAGYNDDVLSGALLLTREPYGGTFLIIDYVETSGYNDAYSYQQNDIMRAGTSYINNFSRQLFIKREDISISGNIMPVDLSFMYNTAVFQKQEAVSPYGNNWLTNYNRLVYTYDNEIGQEYLCYADENGSIQYFSAEENEDGEWVFTDEFENIYGNSGIKVIYNPSEDESDFSLSNIQISNNGYTESFDDLGRLVRITNSHDKYIEITYSDASDLYKISKITDGVGREYRFTYKNGRLSNIQCYNAQGTAIYAGSSTSIYLKTNYYYDDNGNLEKVNYSDSSNAYYTYDAKNRLTSAANRNLYKLSYSYTLSNRVYDVTEYARETSLLSYTKGNCIRYVSFGPREVFIYDTYGSRQHVQFDKCGFVSQIVDEKGNVYNADTGTLVSSSQNLLLNTSFEDGLTSWDVDEESALVMDTENAYHGDKSLKFNVSNSENGGNDSTYVLQSVDVNGGGSYTFSAYVNAAQTDSGSNMIMLINAYDENDEVLASNLRYISSVKNGYKRHSIVLNTPNDTRKIEVAIGIFDSYGTFNVDALQLENQSGASPYNILENGSFTQGVLNWDINKPYSMNTGYINGKLRNTVSFAKAYDADIKMSQTVTVNAQKGDVVTLGGWIKSNTVSNDGNNTLGILAPDSTNFLGDRFAGLVITYQYYSTNENGQNVLNTVVEKKAIHDYINDWQYLENSIIMLADVETVTVSFEFKNHKSEVEVADLCLSKDHLEYDDSLEEDDGETEVTDGGFMEAESFGSSASADADTCQCSHCSNPRCTCTCVNENLCTCSTCRKMFDIQYDDNGNILSITICGYELSELQSINIERTYSADGNYLASAKNENGNTVHYNYNTNNGTLKSQTNAEGNTTNYTYNTRGDLTKVETPVSNLTESANLSTSYGYTNGNLTTITHNGFTYYIEYDKWNNIERVSSHAFSALTDSCSVAAYKYNTDGDHSQLQKITYGNKDTVNYTYDEFGRVIGISYDGGVTNTFEYTYDTLGNIISIADYDTNRYIFYGDDNIAVYTEQHGLIYYAGTDGNGNEFEYSGMALYRTEKDADGTKISSGELETYLNSVTDKFGRTSEKTIELRSIDSENENGYTKITTDYSYGSNNSNENVGKSNVKTISSAVTFDGETKSEYVLSYEYDKNGNITHEYSGSGEDRALRYRYTYDEAEQLVRVDDAIQNKTYVYAYDNGGNRESEKTYAFTTGDALGEVLETKTSKYNYLVWKDRLSSFNGKTVKYDSAGNPTSYDGKTFTWEGRNLKEIALADGSKTQFEYDANGLRTQKRQYDENGDMQYYVDYIWEDGKLQAQYVTLIVYVTYKGVTTAREVGPFTSKIIYDESGVPQGFMVNDAMQYAFVRNLQGDVIAVVDQNGETVMEYSYDPWGNIEYHLSETLGTEEDAMLFTALCPLTYRGYNYDFTTGLYYLQSRYYNPEWGRFINCDDTNILLATQGETHNANLFAYCDNNPVNKVDYTGYKSEDINIVELTFVAWASLELMCQSNTYRNMLNYDILSFEYSFDKYQLVFARFLCYNKIRKEYYVARVLFGETSSWCDFIESEAYENVYWGDNVRDFFVSGLTVKHIYPSIDSKQADGVASALYISTGCIVYFAGLGVNAVKHKSHYIEDDFYRLDTPNGMAAFAEPRTFATKLAASSFVKMNNKPRSYAEFMGG